MARYPIRNLNIKYLDLFRLSDKQLYDNSSPLTVKIITGELDFVKVVHDIGTVAINSMMPNVFTITVRPTIAEKVFYILQLSWDNGKASISIPFEPDAKGQTMVGRIRYYDQAGVEYEQKNSSKTYDVIIPGH